ncbi:MAG: YggT family protein [Candidatus Tectomicrobia bacterium]|nr:YggT family protein [Candidatus Tectomicrobia bacterium]
MDQMVRSLISVIIDIYILLLFVRMFIGSSERFDAVFGLVSRATDPVVTPLGAVLRTRRFDFAPALVILVLLLLKGMMFGSIPRTLLGFASTLFQLYVLIIIIIAGFSEYYTNPIASFGQRLVNPVRAVAANFSRNLTTVNILSVVILIIVHSIITVILSQLAGASPAISIKDAVLGSFGLILNLTTFFVYVVLFNALLSWVNPDPLNPVVQLLALLSAPIVEPIRRVVPPLAGAIDLSPMIAIFALFIARGVGERILSIFA